MLLEKFISATFEQANLMFGWFDENGALLGCSAAFARRLGFSTSAEAVVAVDAQRLGFQPCAWTALWTRLGDVGRVRQSVRALNVIGETEPVLVDVRRIVYDTQMLAAVELVEIGSGSAPTAMSALQAEILERVARGERLREVAERLCLGVEQLVTGVRCSMLRLDGGRLLNIASPSLPAAYTQAIDGLRIGPTVGSCGTAAWYGRPVEVIDIAHDPLWDDYRDFALQYDLRACWSTPIMAHDDKVVGTFAFYYASPRGPSDMERQIVAASCHLAAIAIDSDDQQARIRRLAYLDPLTGLPNRTSFRHEMAQALADLTDDGALAIHCIDLDDFKGVNDTLGHPIGDCLLEIVSDRLRATVDEHATVGRLGGDEFAVLQKNISRPGDVTGLAQKLLRQLSGPLDIDGHTVQLRASIGIARAPLDGRDMDELLKKADLALYAAKRSGRGTYRFFVDAMAEQSRSRRLLEEDLRRALSRGEFALHYQPFVDLATGGVRGVEALIRWFHPRRGLISPAEFIPVAEECGLIDPIGDWVIQEAVTAARKLPRHMTVAINLSPIQLKRPGFTLGVIHALGDSGLSPERLEFEITETALLNQDGSILAALGQLRDLGIRISLDDFGTGYSSLSYLRSFPIDKIKIDRSFVADLVDSTDSAAIVRAVVGLGHDLGIETTAEGVETSDQAVMLTAMGCTAGQGYLYARPAPIDDIIASLTTRYPTALAG